MAAERTVTNDSIVNLISGKVPLQLVLDHIRTVETTQFDLSTTELIRLTKAGVPSVVVEQMRNPKRVLTLPPAQSKQTKAAPAPAPAPVTATSTPAPAPTPAPVPIATGASHVLTTTPVAATPVPVVPQTAAVQLQDTVPIRISLAASVPADAALGRPLRFIASDDFKVQGVVVIRKGASIFGEVSEVAKKGKLFGVGGTKLSFSLSRAEGAGGQDVKVRATAARRADGPTQREVENGKTGSKDIAAAQGAEYIAYVDGPQTVTVPK